MMTDSDIEAQRVIGGIDTHKEVHVAAVLDELGRLLGTASFPTTVGYRRLHRWLCALGEVLAVGVEGTGSRAAGLSRFFRARGVNIVEVNRPNRRTRRRKGKSDPVDAEMAARAVLAGDATVTSKAGDGPVETSSQRRPLSPHGRFPPTRGKLSRLGREHRFPGAVRRARIGVSASIGGVAPMTDCC